MNESDRVRFGPFSLDLRTEELRARGELRALRPQAARALALLVRRAPALVTREELRHELWNGTAVEWEAGLHQVIRQVRRALGDDAREPRYVETVARRGYRFRGAVSVAGPGRAAAARIRRRGAGMFLGGVAASLGALVVLIVVLCGLLAR